MRFQIGDEVNYKKELYTVVVNPCRVVALCLSGLYVVDNCNERWYLHDEDLELVEDKSFEKWSKAKDCAVALGKEAKKAMDNLVVESILTNKQGGQNSKIEGRYDLLPPFAIKELAKVYEEGAKKYEADNWKKVDVEDHINHALAHVFQYLKYNRRFDMNQAKKYPEEIKIEELSHAFCRLSMALELLLRKT